MENENLRANEVFSNWNEFTEKMKKDNYPVYCLLNLQVNPCKAYITLDPKSKEIDTDYKIQTGQSFDEFHNRILMLEVPPMATARGIQLYIEHNLEFFNAYLNSYSEEWNGSNYIGIVSEEIQEKIDDINCYQYPFEEIGTGLVCTASEFLNDYSLTIKDEILDNHEYIQIDSTEVFILTENSTKEEIKKASDFINKEIEDSGVCITDSIENELIEMIENLN